MLKVKIMAFTVSALLFAATLAMAQTSDQSSPANQAGTVTNGSTPVAPGALQPKKAAPASMSAGDQQRTGVTPTLGNVANAPVSGSPGATGFPTAPK